MLRKDDFILSLIENIRKVKFCLNPTLWKISKKMNSLPRDGRGQDLYIVLNAPSLKTQDLSVLKGTNLMFVNRGFMHPMYKELQPKYHVFIDAKMLKGVWPIAWLDKIWELSPDTKIILPLSWYNDPLLCSYRKDARIYWLKSYLPFYNLGVSGACFDFAIQQLFDTIYFTGFDATGIAYEMIQSSGSHFYGNDEELMGKSTSQLAIDLLMHSRHLHDLNRLASYCGKHSIKVVNLTNGGLLDMFYREAQIPLLNDVYSSIQSES